MSTLYDGSDNLECIEAATGPNVACLESSHHTQGTLIPRRFHHREGKQHPSSLAAGDEPVETVCCKEKHSSCAGVHIANQ